MCVVLGAWKSYLESPCFKDHESSGGRSIQPQSIVSGVCALFSVMAVLSVDAASPVFSPRAVLFVLKPTKALLGDSLHLPESYFSELVALSRLEKYARGFSFAVVIDFVF